MGRERLYIGQRSDRSQATNVFSHSLSQQPLLVNNISGMFSLNFLTCTRLTSFHVGKVGSTQTQLDHRRHRG